MKEHIVELCNRELAHQAVADDEDDRSADTPLVRVYDFLRE